MVQPEPLTRLTVVDELEAHFAQAILDGELPPGELLPPERTLAEHHGVNRTSLRQALARLERSGLIETRQGSGSRVRALEEDAGAEVLALVTARRRRDWIGEVFEARRLVGALVARRAAVERTQTHVDRLRALVAEVAAADPAGAQRAEAELHRVLAQATGNRVFVLLVNSMLRAYRPLHRRLRGAFADPAAVAEALEPLVAAISARRPAAAERAAQDYFAATEAFMAPALAGEDE
jgi:GntR family transcriptional repressor for pyruvate dehydrogenase complex